MAPGKNRKGAVTPSIGAKHAFLSTSPTLSPNLLAEATGNRKSNPCCLRLSSVDKINVRIYANANDSHSSQAGSGRFCDAQRQYRPARQGLPDELPLVVLPSLHLHHANRLPTPEMIFRPARRGSVRSNLIRPHLRFPVPHIYISDHRLDRSRVDRMAGLHPLRTPPRSRGHNYQRTR